MDPNIKKIRSIANYQFGQGTGEAIFTDDVSISYSKNTGRIRHVSQENTLLATLKPNDGKFTLTIAGAKKIIANKENFAYYVKVNTESAEAVSQGRNVFAKHVLDQGEVIRPSDEVIVLDENGSVVGVGKSILTKKEAAAFKIGVAVKVRRGSESDA
jgi:predicted RNA-binding protein (TIGR00451 family)